MRVLVVTTWFPSAAAPTEAPFNLEHVRAIARSHEVRVVHLMLNSAASRATTETYQGIRVQRIPLSPRSPVGLLRGWRRVRAALRRADLLHTMAFSSILAVWPAQLLLRRPWVHTEHWNGVVNPASVGRAWARLSWLRRALRFPDRLTGVTTQLAEVMARFGRPGAVSVVPCVVENPNPVTRAAFGPRRELIAVGALIERKQPLMAVRTLAWLRSEGHRAHLTWVGDGELRSAVERFAAEQGVADCLSLIGSRPPEEIFPLMASADLFFLPTTQENFFTSAAEALSAGRAVVVPRVGGYDDYIDESNGVLVAENRPEAFGEAILRASERFAGVDADAIARPIRSRFSAETVGASFDAIYRELAGSVRGRFDRTPRRG